LSNKILGELENRCKEIDFVGKETISGNIKDAYNYPPQV